MSRYQLDAYSAIERARDEMTSFVRASFRFQEPRLDEAVHTAIAAFGLVASPVVEATFPFEVPATGPRTTRELADDGVLHPDLPGLLAAARGEAHWPEDRPLYVHQVNALRHYRRGKSIIVASGTGSGKTECFLFPALDTVLRDLDLSRPGVRVLIVYPLNALVNNQMERLRAVLGDHPTIRFALYTRRLAETTREAERKLRKRGLVAHRAELISREQLRERPPHILVTNFSMLEYALVRPADASIFADHFAKPRLLVIDEAHVYAGSMAAELTLLMRRAWLRWGINDPSSVQGIATSATMHQRIDDGPARLRQFAAALLSKSATDMETIEGCRVLPQSVGPEIDVPLPPAAAVAALDTNFATLTDELVNGEPSVEFDASDESRRCAQKIIDILRPGFAPSEEGTLPAALLIRRALEPLRWVRELRDSLNRESMRIDRLAAGMFSENEPLLERVKATHRVLETLAVAREVPDNIPLLPVRIHATVRGPHGVYACVNGDCPEAVRPGVIGRLHTEPVGRCTCGSGVYELRICDSCGQSFILGARGVNDGGFPALVAEGRRGEVSLFACQDHWDDGEPFPSEVGKAPKQETIRVDTAPCALGSGRPLWEFPGGLLRGPERRLVGVACPRCGSQRPSVAVIRRVNVGNDAALQVLVDGVYPSLPRHRAAASRWLRGEGRRLLLFADNRQVAAALAAKVEESHDTLLARRIIVEALDSATEKGDSPRAMALQEAIVAAVKRKDFEGAARLDSELEEARQAAQMEGIDFDRLAVTITRHPALSELSNHKHRGELNLAKMIIARELGRRPGRLGNLEANGVISIEYGILFPAPRHPEVRAVFQDNRWTEIVAVLLDMLRTDGSCIVPNLGDYDEFLPRHLLGRPLIKESSRATAANPSGEDDDRRAEHGRRRIKTPVALLPAGTGVRPVDSRRFDYIEKVLAALGAPSSITPALILEEVWSTLEEAAPAGRVQTSSSSPLRRGDEPGQIELGFHMLRFRSSRSGPLFRCSRCRTSWSRDVAGVCPTNGCGGALRRVTPGAELDPRDRIVARAAGPNKVELCGLASEEHTAQILPEDLEESERRFKAGELNALVCSTTMELGIDIGGLSATLMTNVPPGPANYLQRAGRAGRRAEGTALVLTFARPRPFDQAAFADPERPFTLPITPPKVKLDSPRICRRHIFAYLLTQFFRRFDAAVATPNPLAVLSSVKSFFREAIARVGHIDVAVVDLIEKVLRLDAKQETMCQAFIAWLVDVALTDQALTQELVALIHDTAFGKADMEEIVENCWMNIEKISSSVKTQLDYLEGELNKERQKPEAAWDRGLIKALEYQKKDLESESLLSYLAEQQFLPRYGFPIQVVPLVERWEDYDEDRTPEHPRLRLDRDVALALNEYAPGAEVVAGKHVHVSRGLLRHWTGEDAPGVLATRFVALCSNCGQAQYARNQGEIRNPCPTCRQVDPRQIPVVNPKLGFAVQWGTRPKRWAGGVNSALRPVTEAVYAAREGDRASEVCQGLALAYDEEGEVLVRTEGSLVESDLSGASASSAPIGARREGYGYAICYLCGRAEPETAMPTTGKNNKQIDPLPELLRGHQRLRGKGTCEAKTHYWRHMSLAGALRTETLRTELRGRLALPSGEAGVRLATTWMVALQLASGEVLGVDSREIGGLLSPRQSGADYVYDIILYDQVAGGVGHCRALLDRWEDLMSAARRRLTCPNPACTNACHRCLLAFESQRYEPLLRRRRLLEFLDPGWALLQQKVERDNIPVMPVFRGGSEVREYLARSPFAEVTIVASHLGPGAMADGGWLRWLLRHADGQGKVRLVLDKLPNPDSDEERITALRLRISMEMGKVSVHVAPAGAAASFSWPISASGSGSGDVYSVEASNGADPLGSSWIGPASRVFRASGPTAVVDARGRVEHLVGASKLCAAVVLEPKHVAPAIVVHNIPALAMGAQATFAYWFKNARNELLNARSLRSVTIVDPYLQTDWQVTLLEDVARFFKANGCRQMDVVTYAPAPEKENWGLGVNRTLSATDQRRRITVASGNAAWKPREEPTDKLLRLHQRYIEGLREDGTRFVVFMERGLDFIVLDRSRQTRTTRPSYIVVKEE